MAAVSPTMLGSRVGATRVWAITSSGDEARVFGHQCAVYVSVDTANADTVTVSLSPDGTEWFDLDSYTANTIVQVPPCYAVKATWSAGSKVYVHGLNLGGQ